MQAIITLLSSLFDGIWSLIRIAFWLIRGMLNYSTVLQGSLNIFTDALAILPGVVTSAILAATGVLITLRILGR